jgi:hypothetical protein
LEKFECSTLGGFVVVLVYDGDYEALKYSATKGTIVVVTKEEVNSDVKLD